MNREQACAELAKRTGWTQVENGTGYAPGNSWPQYVPSYFTDHAEARELAEWFAMRGSEDWDKFAIALMTIRNVTPDNNLRRFMKQWLLTEPHEIAAAACEVFGIKLDAA